MTPPKREKTRRSIDITYFYELAAGDFDLHKFTQDLHNAHVRASIHQDEGETLITEPCFRGGNMVGVEFIAERMETEDEAEQRLKHSERLEREYYLRAKQIVEKYEAKK
jgi:hypothetical protein